MDGKLRNMTAVYLLHGNEILFLYRKGSRVVGDSYVGSAGGHFEKDELNDAKACVLRELKEETGLEEKDVRDLRMRYVTLRLKNGEIRQNYYFFAYLDELNMSHSAWYVVDHFLREGKNTDYLYGGVTVENGVKFTVLSEF